MVPQRLLVARTLAAAVLLGWIIAFTAVGRAAAQETYDPDAIGQQHAERHAAKLAQARQGLRSAGEDSRSHLALGDAFLRSGRVEQAIQEFDRAIELAPALEPQLWQRGIALYFAKRYADGQLQFQKHRTVNPHDVENAAWHYLCVAKDSSLQQARQSLMAVVGDGRAPMAEILQYLGGGPRAAIDDRVASLQSRPAAHASARFYADLYLGLAADAAGDRRAARQAMARAALSPETHYMADVARLYAQRLAEQER